MTNWRRICNKLRFLFNRRRFEREITEEMDFHRLMLERDKTQQGFNRDHATASARRQFGNVVLARESAREAWTIDWLDTLARDVRYALRTWLRQPGFAGVAMM